VLKAEINPHYFTSPIGTTTFYLQWGTAECIDGDGWGASCVQTQPAPPGTTLDSPPVDEAVTAQAVLSELAPETAYRYRFVAEGSGAPGEPVFGAGGVPGVEGTDAEVTTMSSASTLPPCSNDAFRLGSGGALRDCRAYELVSPLDKAGGDVQARLNLVYFEARADQASTSGDEVTFSAYRAFQDPESAPFSSQFLTRRDPAVGWQTEAISPPQEGEAFINPGLAIDNLYRAFAPDLSQSWLYTYTEPLLGPGAIAGEPNVYRRDNETATYQACTVTPPLSDQAETHGAQLQGFSESGDLAVFKIEGKLTADGSDQTKSGGRPINQVYACSYTGGVAEVRLVSALPSGEASDLENSAGGPANELFQFDQGRAASLDNAVAADGSKVFWTASAADDTEQPGALYLRLNPGAPPTVSGTCDVAEADKACTVQISAGPARLWTAAEDGSVAFFSDASGQLYEYRVATASTLPVAADVVGVLGASENGRRLYFISEADLAEGAVADEPNLYLYQRGVGNTFIAGLSELDAQQGDAVPSPGNSQPAWHTARVTPDGSAVVFMSNNAELAELVAEYDNTDQLTGLPAGEIYRFAIGEELSCISCNRTGQRPRGRQVQNKLGPNPILPVASMLPTWLNSLYAPRVVSADGTRIFFEAFEPLVARDTNGKADVYQWEAEGIGSCTATDSAYDPQSEGCVSLISSGTSTTDSQFVDASPEGDDVFIRTAAPLVDWDPGAIDIYDARVGGGFSAPSLPPNPEDECKGESCAPPVRPIPPPAIPPTTAPGDGNVRQPKPKTCPKGKRKVKRNGKVSCVKAKKQNRKAKKGNDKARQTRSADR
jgi:hypothetical protein